MAEKTLDQFTQATAKPGILSRVFFQDSALTSPQSRAATLRLLMETIRDGLTVNSMAVSNPTSLTPTTGDTYVVNPTGAGGWTGQNNAITVYDGSSWLFSTPTEGWRVYDQNTNKVFEYNGTAWAVPQAAVIGYDGTTSGLAATDTQAAIDEVVTEKANLTGATFTGPVVVPSYAVASLPTAATGGIIYVSDETGGAVLAFSDGTDWRRVTDRAVVS